MSNGDRPNQTIILQRKQFRQVNLKDLPKTRDYLLVGLITLFALAVISVYTFVSKRGTSHQTAERPWVTVQEATIVGPLVQHNLPKATVRLKNTGHSPALTTQMRLVMTVWPSKQFPNWDMPLKLTADAERLGTIGSGAISSQTVALIAPLSDVQGMYLERKDWFIVILGVVSYVDLFGNSYLTNLCLIWRDVASERLSFCEKWNEAD